jgi:hypothetical protein
LISTSDDLSKKSFDPNASEIIIETARKDLLSVIKPVNLNKRELEKPAICDLTLKQNKFKQQEVQLLTFLQSNSGYNNLEYSEKLISCLKSFDYDKYYIENNAYLQNQGFKGVKVFKRLSYEDISFKKRLESLIKKIENNTIEGRKNESDFSLKVNIRI